MKRIFITLILGLLTSVCFSLPTSQMVVQLNVDGAIGPASQDYIQQGLHFAAQSGAALIILQLDTPGGLAESMRIIIKDILASPIPVVTYVAPAGARAASAGTYILYASHIAAMAPGTNLGAATPVQLGGMPDVGKKEQDSAAADQQANAMEKKILEDSRAYIRSLAQLRGRNQQWAEQAVLKGKSLSANEALANHVIDVIAEDIPQLLEKINGKQVTLHQQKFTLQTSSDMNVLTVKQGWRNKLLAAITNPNIAYILLLLGIYGLIFEFTSPGAIAPGVIGGISLIVGLYALQMLSVNYAGLALILLGICFMVAEIFVASFGILGIGGVIAFIVGSILLMHSTGNSLSLPLIILISIINALIFFALITLAVRAQRRRAVSGREVLIGKTVIAHETFDGEGYVQLGGELWKAKSKHPISKGQTVKIIGRDGLTLIVSQHSHSSQKGESS